MMVVAGDLKRREIFFQVYPIKFNHGIAMEGNGKRIIKDDHDFSTEQLSGTYHLLSAGAKITTGLRLRTEVLFGKYQW